MKKSISILFCAILCIVAMSILSGCTDSSSFEQAITETAEVVSPSLDDTPFELIKVGQDSDNNFMFYRDSVTDVLYVAFKSGYAGGLTVMEDPETGLPMTYTRYMELSENAPQAG